jgi:hypothetical protein
VVVDRDVLFPAMACLTALPAGLCRQIAITREAAILVRHILSALAARGSGEVAILAEAAFLVRHALPAFRGDRTLFLGVHRGESTVAC